MLFLWIQWLCWFNVESETANEPLASVLSAWFSLPYVRMQQVCFHAAEPLCSSRLQATDGDSALRLPSRRVVKEEMDTDTNRLHSGWNHCRFHPEPVFIKSTSIKPALASTAPRGKQRSVNSWIIFTPYSQGSRIIIWASSGNPNDLPNGFHLIQHKLNWISTKL